MAYVAISGGAKAIKAAAQSLELLRARSAATHDPIATSAIEHQFHALISRLLSEGGVHYPQLAALAAKQAAGDSLEASFLLRAWRSTRPRLADVRIDGSGQMRCIRRISAAFKDIAGGQFLGPTPDFSHRLLRMGLLDESPEAFRAALPPWLGSAVPDTVPVCFPKVLAALREQGLIDTPAPREMPPYDLTRIPLVFPVPRSAALMAMTRGETGGMLAIAYSNMRGYGDVHPTIGELRVGYVPICVPHPVTGEAVEAGEILMTECEVVAMYDAADGGKATFGLGYGACFGHNEVKAIAMAILDRSLQVGRQHGARNPSENAEFVLMHIDGIESMGFCTHYKMPHYVTFQSDLDRLRETQRRGAASVGTP